MNPYAWAIAGTITGIAIFALIITLRWGWNRLCNWAARHLETIMADALEQPINTRYRDLDAEYRALVITQHNENN